MTLNPFRSQPKQLAPSKTQFNPVPEGPATQTARQKYEGVKAAIADTEAQHTAIAGDLDAAVQRAADATARRSSAEQLIRRAALGEGVQAPTPEELMATIQAQIAAEHAADAMRATAQSEATRSASEMEKLRSRLADAERAIDITRFNEVLALYRAAIEPAIPLARVLRQAAIKLHKKVDGEPLLIDPEADYGRLLFGAYL